MSAHASDDVLDSAGACADQFSNAAGYVAPKPFSSTICPEDKAMRLAIYHFPATMESVINILNLDKKTEIIDSIKTTSIEDGTQENYGNEILNIERASMELQELAILVAKVMISVQLLIAAFIALKDGEFGGKTFGGYKTAFSFGLGIFLITPIPIYTSLMDKSVDVLVVQILMGAITVAAIGAANMMISTVGYLTISELPDERDKSFSDITADPNLISIPLTKTRVFIEDAICQNQSALLGVYDGAYNEGDGANASLSKLGMSYKYSSSTDGSVTWAEFGETTMGTFIRKGTSLDEVGGSDLAGMECSYTTVIKPRWKPVYDLGLEERVEQAAGNLKFSSLANSTKLREEWALLQSSLLSLLEGHFDAKVNANNKVAIESGLLAAANYFYDIVAYRAAGGGLVDQETEALELYNRRAQLADTFAKTILEQRCYTDREGYIRSKSTIKSLKRGNVGAADFSLKCAAVDESGINIAFDAKSNSAEGFASSTITKLSESNTYLQEIYVNLYKSFEGLEQNIEYARNRSLADVTRTVFFKDESTSGRSIGHRGIVMRVEGFGSFAHLYTSLMKSLHNTFTQTVKAKYKTAYTNPEYVVVNYSSESRYLTETASELKKDFQSDKVHIPEFVFATPSGKTADPNDYESKVISNIESQFTTNQGGTFNGNGRSQAKGAWDDGAVATELGLTVSDGVQGVSQAGISTVINKIFQNFALASSSKEDGDYYAFGAIEHNKVLQACGRGMSDSEIREKLGEDGLKKYEVICPNYIVHPLFKNQEIGVEVVKGSLIGLVILKSSRFSTKAYQFMKKKRDKAAKKQVDGGVKDGSKNKSSVGNKSDKTIDKENAQSGFLRKAGEIVGGIALNDLAYTIMKIALIVLLLLGLVMSVITPLVPILTYMFSYLGWAILFVQLMVVSAFVALTLFIISTEKGGGAHKSFTGVFINLFIRPVSMIIGFVVAYVITYISFMVFNMAMVNILVGIGGGGDVFFSPFEYLMDAVLLLIMWMAHLFIIKAVFEICLKAPNTIVKLFGAETLDARESHVSNMAYAAASRAAEVNKSAQEELNKKALNKIISNSNQAHYDYMEQQARTAANSAGKALGAAKEMAVGTMASSEIAEKMNDFANKKVTAKDEVSKAQAAEVKNESKSNDSQNQGDFNNAHENSKYSDQSEDSVNETFDDSKDDFKKS
jgi:hypothetical protein